MVAKKKKPPNVVDEVQLVAGEMYGPMVIYIGGSPHKFKVHALSWYGFLGNVNIVCRAQHCEQLQHYHSAISFVSVRNSATSTTNYCSRPSKLPKMPASGVTSSSRWEMSPCPLATSLTRIAMSYTRTILTAAPLSRRIRLWS